MRWLTGAALALAGGSVLAAPPKLPHFAYAAEITLAGDAASHTLQLPEAVYAGLTRADFGDLRVFNASGELVPQRLIQSQPVRQEQAQRQSLPLYPLMGDARDEELHLRLRRGEQVEDLRISQGPDRPPLLGYLVDRGEERLPASQLHLDWPPKTEERSLIVPVSVEVSDDLERWQTLIESAAVADLKYQGQHLRRDRIELPPTEARYLRISYLNPQRVLALSGVKARLSKTTEVVTFESATLETRQGFRPDEFLFETPGRPPLYRIQIQPPQTNTAAAVSLLGSNTEGSDWELQKGFQVYRLRDGDQEVYSPPQDLPGVSFRHWKIAVDISGGGLGKGLPTVQLAWRPHELIFLARGPGPFTLAWGSVHVDEPPDNNIPESAVISALPAELGTALSRPGGEAALEKPTSWPQVLLWLVLGLGALIAAVLGWRLLHQLDQKPFRPTEIDKD